MACEKKTLAYAPIHIHACRYLLLVCLNASMRKLPFSACKMNDESNYAHA